MDFDLRLLRRTYNLAAREVFDTVIAARMLGLQEFSYAALVQKYFDVTLAKGSQKANWRVVRSPRQWRSTQRTTRIFCFRWRRKWRSR
jgi:ribonuclease D